MLTKYYIDNYPFNIEGAQKLSMQWSPDIVWDYENDGYPTGTENVFDWSSEFKPVTYEVGQMEVLHVWMRFKIGDVGTWSTPMRINYPTVVEGAKGAQGVKGEQGDRGLIGLTGAGVEIQYADEYYNIVSFNSNYIMFVRTRIKGGSWSTWVRIKGIDGVGTGGTGLPSGGTDTQVLATLGTTPTWVDEDTIYNDADAVNAMGVLGDSNPLNHDKYTDVEAVAAMGVLGDSNPLNHNRYTDAEVQALIDTSITNDITAISPLIYSANTLQHSDIVGNKHVPSGDTTGYSLIGDGSGNLSWDRMLEYAALNDSGTSTADVWSASKIQAMLTASTYGIKYSWADAAARAAESGMSTDDLGVQRDTGDVYKYDGAVWNVFFSLYNTSHDHNSLYTLTSDLVTPSIGNLVDWTNIANVPATVGLWEEFNIEYITPISTATNKLYISRSVSGGAVGVEYANSSGVAGSSCYAQYEAGNGPDIVQLQTGVDVASAFLLAAGGNITPDLYTGVLNTGGKILFTIGGTMSSPTIKASIDNLGLKLNNVTANEVIVSDSNQYIISEAKKTAFNSDFGTTSVTVSRGDHSHDGLLVKGIITSADDLNDFRTTGLYIFEEGAVPANMISNDIARVTTEELTAASKFYLRVIELDDTVVMQEIGYRKGHLARRDYSGAGGWLSWSAYWANTDEVLAGGDKCGAISPYTLDYRLTRHGDWVAITLYGSYASDGVATISSRINNDNTLTIQGRVTSTGSPISSFMGALDDAHKSLPRFPSNNKIFFTGFTDLGARVHMALTSAGLLDTADGTLLPAQPININVTIPTV